MWKEGEKERQCVVMDWMRIVLEMLLVQRKRSVVCVCMNVYACVCICVHVCVYVVSTVVLLMQGKQGKRAKPPPGPGPINGLQPDLHHHQVLLALDILNWMTVS